jgi:CHAT domain-containing protein/CheY-like chemotaxis protein
MERILIVEDNEELRFDIKQVAEKKFSNCKYIEASTVQEATELMNKVLFRLVITDLKLPEKTGLIADSVGGVIVAKKAKKRDPATQVIAISSFKKYLKEIIRIKSEMPDGIHTVDRSRPDVYLDILEVEIKNALQLYERERRQNQQSIVLSLPDRRGGKPTIKRSGADAERSRKGLEIEPQVLKAASAAIGSLVYVGETEYRKAMSQYMGRHIWNRTFRDHEVLLWNLGVAQGRINNDYNLIFNIESKSDALDLPLELIHDGKGSFDGKGYLALRHPICRRIRGANPEARGVDNLPSLMENLRNENHYDKTLRILLIAANTASDDLGPIPMVDNEIDHIEKFIKKLEPLPFKIRIKVDKLNTWDISEKNLLNKLQEGFHIIHYAGHGTYDDRSPDNSSIYAWSKACSESDWSNVANESNLWYSDNPSKRTDFIRKIVGLKGDICPINTSELSSKIAESPPSLVFLSCCHSARAGFTKDFVFNNSLGMVDAIVRAGVPAVVGHRWPLVDDLTSLKFVEEFYTKLLTDYTPEQAIFWARKAISNKIPDWASAILVVQSSTHE